MVEIKILHVRVNGEMGSLTLPLYFYYLYFRHCRFTFKNLLFFFFKSGLFRVVIADNLFRPQLLLLVYIDRDTI